MHKIQGTFPRATDLNTSNSKKKCPQKESTGLQLDRVHIHKNWVILYELSASQAKHNFIFLAQQTHKTKMISKAHNKST